MFRPAKHFTILTNIRFRKQTVIMPVLTDFENIQISAGYIKGVIPEKGKVDVSSFFNVCHRYINLKIINMSLWFFSRAIKIKG